MRAPIWGIPLTIAVGLGIALIVVRVRTDIPQRNQGLASLLTASRESSLLEGLMKQRWLIVFQNPYELRATGGFWGTVGLVYWPDRGQMTYWIDDVYAVDGPANWNNVAMPPPPTPIQRYIQINSWYLRDANWDPDFPTSAKRAITFFERETQGKESTNAVAAVNPEVLQDILTVTGPITVDGVTIASENTLDAIIEAVEISYRKNGIAPARRKTILSHLVQAIVEHPKRNQVLLALTQKLVDYQRRGIIQLYAQDPAVEQKIVASGWSGRLEQPADDYLAVIDSNLAALKTDAVMERETEYAVLRSSDQTIATLTLTYRNNAKRFDYRTTRYRTYTRVFVPSGARLLSSTGTLMNDRLFEPSGRVGPVDRDSYQEKTVFGFFLSVEPRETRQVVLRYSLPRRDNALQNPYRLFVEHQSGVPKRPLTVRFQSDTTPEPPIVIQREGKTDEVIEIPLQ